MSFVIDSSAIHAVFAKPQPDGVFDRPVLDYLREIGSRRKIVLLAFAPKAAGTYLRQAAIYAIGGQLIRTSHAQGGRDSTFYLPNVLTCYLDDDAPEPVTHVHMQALPANRHFIEAFGMKPIIMIRNIPDMLASFWDMLESDPVARADGLNCQIPFDFTEISHEKKGDFLIDIIAPWYASYFATWKTFVDEAGEVVRVLRYDEFAADPVGVLQIALLHTGHPTSLNECKAALARAWHERDGLRFNKGRSGRGKDYFSLGQLERLSRMLSCYPQLGLWRDDLVAA